MHLALAASAHWRGHAFSALSATVHVLASFYFVLCYYSTDFLKAQRNSEKNYSIGDSWIIKTYDLRRTNQANQKLYRSCDLVIP
jgi:hypothetical protein